MIELRRIPNLWQRWDVTVRDLPLAVLLAVMSVIPALQKYGTQLGDLPRRPFDALTALVIALECLPIAGRRRWPALCLALVSAGFVIDQLRVYHTVAGSALPIALMSAGAHLERHRRTVLLLIGGAYLLFVAVLDRRGSGEGVTGFTTFFLAMVLAWGFGAWLRQTRRTEEERRARLAEDTRTAERTRIARELHDVVTHHVTAMVVQAEAARYLTAAPDRLDGTLAAVGDTGRRAISDLRQMLDLLDPEHGAEPPADGIRTLVGRTRQAGQPVELTEDGEPREAAGRAEAAAHRVVREALTNALKHDHGAPTVVHVRYGPREISVQVSSDGSGSDAASPGGSGRGLAGLRERVGGEFTAGRQTGGHFVVQARIPTGTPS
ncbi:histidine kinase [Actinoplanes sp. M2I2]|uniref:sensor histidine kinase n=1 Tax=Actinoplanes sp. M2I2 TaxID=1734444 RepID=UPI0020206DF7|nr:histidine kinase [Actinoplanes sp. M2I2]